MPNIDDSHINQSHRPGRSTLLALTGATLTAISSTDALAQFGAMRVPCFRQAPAAVVPKEGEAPKQAQSPLESAVLPPAPTNSPASKELQVVPQSPILQPIVNRDPSFSHLSPEDLKAISELVDKKLQDRASHTSAWTLGITLPISIAGLALGLYGFLRVRSKMDMDLEQKRRAANILYPQPESFIIEDLKQIEIIEKAPFNGHKEPIYQLNDQRLNVEAGEIFKSYVLEALQWAAERCRESGNCFPLDYINEAPRPTRWIRDMLVGFDLKSARQIRFGQSNAAEEIMRALERKIELRFGGKVIDSAVEGKAREITYVMVVVVCDIEAGGKIVIKPTVFTEEVLQKFGDKTYVAKLKRDNPPKIKEIDLAVRCHVREMRAREQSKLNGLAPNPYPPGHDRNKEPMGGALQTVAVSRTPPKS